MTAQWKPIGLLLLAAGLLACGGSLKGNGGADGSTPGACATLGACECMAASDLCAPRTEACYCPTSCDPNIACICGGGRFLACEEKAVFAGCASVFTAVQTKCAGQAFVQYIGGVCTSGSDPTCVANCLSALNNTGSCSEIDCYFCPACDCAAPPMPSPFRACLQTCTPLLPED
jgi:hypothetical protein